MRDSTCSSFRTSCRDRHARRLSEPRNTVKERALREPRAWLLVSVLSIAFGGLPLGCSGRFGSCVELRTCGGGNEGGNAGAGQAGEGSADGGSSEGGTTTGRGGSDAGTGGSSADAGSAGAPSRGGEGGDRNRGGEGSDSDGAGQAGEESGSDECVFDVSTFGSGCVFAP